MTSTNQNRKSVPGRRQGRKPADVVAAQMGVSSQQEMIWRQVRHLKQFTREELHRAILRKCQGMHDNTVTRYLERLTRGGYLEMSKERDEYGYLIWSWTLVRDTGVEVPKLKVNGQPSSAGRVKDQMWRSMKVIGEFNYVELAAAATTEEVPVAVGSAKAYIWALHRVGYLVKIRKGKTGTPARYRTVPMRVEGPKPPMVLRNKSVFDQNLLKVMEPITG